MVKKQEEPLFLDVKKNSPQGEDARVLVDDIRRLCESQPFAVLATQGKGIKWICRFNKNSDYHKEIVLYMEPLFFYHLYREYPCL